MPRKHIKVELDLYLNLQDNLTLQDIIEDLECEVEFKNDDIDLRNFAIADAWEEDE